MTETAYCSVLDALCWATRTFDRFPGRWRLMHWLSGRAGRLSGCRPRVVRTRGGFLAHVDPADVVQRHIFLQGQFDEITRRLMHAVCRRGDCVLDVGANVGYFTMVAARAVGPVGAVHAFEASPVIAPLLRRNLRLNRMRQVTVHELAVSDRHGRLTFHTSTPDQRGRSSIRDLGDASAHTAEVPTLPLDAMLDDLPPVRLVKMDIEGAEPLALAGMRNLLRRDTPYLLLEMTDDWFRQMGSSAERICAELRAQGYRLFRTEYEGVAPLAGSAIPQDAQWDAFCVHESKPLPRVCRLARVASAL